MERGAAPASDVSAAGFELDAIETGDGTISVSGRWRGVRGRRFMRPSLSVAGEGMRALADLQHKPWPAEDGESWIAVFPWERPLAGVEALELEVAPDLTVRLPIGDEGRPSAPPAGRTPSAAEARLREALSDRDAARAQRDRALNDRERALGELHEAVQTGRQAESARRAMAGERDAATRERDRMRQERDAARQETERLTKELGVAKVRAEAEAEAARTQLALAQEQLSAAHEDLAAARKNLAAAERELLSARAEPRPPAPIELPTTAAVPPLSTVPSRPRRTLDWEENPYARWVAAGAVLLVALILLLILVLS